MKKLYLLSWIICWMGLWVACGEAERAENTETPLETVTEEERQYKPLSLYSEKFRKIVKTDEGVLRGIDFGDELEEVYEKEDTIPLEDSARYVSFTIALDEEEKELTDVIYYFDKEQKIKSFTLDIYLNNKSSVDSLAREFKNYYTERFGQPTIQEKKALAWNGEENMRVVMRDVGIKEAPGLQIQIAKTQPQVQ